MTSRTSSSAALLTAGFALGSVTTAFIAYAFVLPGSRPKKKRRSPSGSSSSSRISSISRGGGGESGKGSAAADDDVDASDENKTTSATYKSRGVSIGPPEGMGGDGRGGRLRGSSSSATAARLGGGDDDDEVSPPTPPPTLRQRSAYALHQLSLSRIDRVNFLTDLITQLWPYVNSAGSAMIREMMEPMIEEMAPGPLQSMRFQNLDLGPVPIRLDNVVVHQRRDDDDAIQFDLDVDWDAKCDIRLKADYIGSFGVKSIRLSGRMAILLRPLIHRTPCISAIQYAFVNPPTLNMEFSGLAKVADVSIVDKTMQKIVRSTMNGMVVLPNRMLYKMDLANDFLQTHQLPLGLLNVTAVSGRGFEVEEKTIGKDDIPDVYLNITFGASTDSSSNDRGGEGDGVWRTSTVPNSLCPAWNETGHFVLSDHDQLIGVHAWDEDKSPIDPDDDLGCSDITVGELLLAAEQNDDGTKELELRYSDDDGDDEGEGTGAYVSLRCTVSDLVPDLRSFFRSPTHRGPNKLVGILSVVVARAFDVPLARNEAATFVRVVVVAGDGGDREYYTGAVKDCPPTIDALNPTYDTAFLVPLTHGMVSSTTKAGGGQRRSSSEPGGKVEFHLMNGEDELGTIVVPLTDVASSDDMEITDRRRLVRSSGSNDDGGDGDGASAPTLEFRVTLRGVQLSAEEVAKLDDPSSIDEMTKKEQEDEAEAEIDDAVLVSPSTSSPAAAASYSPSSTKQKHVKQNDGIDTVRLTAVSGRGFRVQKRMFKKDDVPDVYVKMKFGQTSQEWRTSTIKNCLEPEWNESNVFMVSVRDEVVQLDLYDEDKGRGDSDDYLGSAVIPVAALVLSDEATELPLFKSGRPTGCFVTVAGALA